jgi:L-threonine kinase
LSLLREIEPTDGIMFNQMACFDHKNVTNYGLLGTLPMLTVIAVDEGGAVDTVAFNQENRVHSHAVKIEYDRLRIDIQVAIKICDLRRVGEISTRSAQLIQKWNPKNHLNLFIDLCKDTDALGIVVAHSGTYIGLLLDKREESYCSQKNKVFTRLQEQGLSPKVFSTLPKADVIAQEKVDMEASLDFFYE